VNGFDTILGHGATIDRLQRMRERDRLPQALLFEGPEAVGKATVARLFAAGLLCNRVEEAPCGECASCRLVASGGHPDLTRVHLLPRPNVATGDGSRPIAPEDLRKVIIVDQIRDLALTAAFGPRVGRRRVFVIDPADQMNIAAQNALLKTLEEPPGDGVLILIASRPFLLLPTIRSRCFSVRFAALPTPELAELLTRRGIESEEALVRAALAEGLPGRALDLDLESVRARRDEILEMLEELAASRKSLASLADHAANLAGKNELSLLEGLAIAESLLRDAARAATRRDDLALIHADLADRLERLGRQLAPDRAASIVRSLERMRSGLRFNLNRTLVAESLLAAVAGGPIP
jgi:DNA polymerase-3 subunit delta'